MSTLFKMYMNSYTPLQKEQLFRQDPNFFTDIQKRHQTMSKPEYYTEYANFIRGNKNDITTLKLPKPIFDVISKDNYSLDSKYWGTKFNPSEPLLLEYTLRTMTEKIEQEEREKNIEEDKARALSASIKSAAWKAKNKAYGEKFSKEQEEKIRKEREKNEEEKKYFLLRKQSMREMEEKSKQAMKEKEKERILKSEDEQLKQCQRYLSNRVDKNGNASFLNLTYSIPTKRTSAFSGGKYKYKKHTKKYNKKTNKKQNKTHHKKTNKKH